MSVRPYSLYGLSAFLDDLGKSEAMASQCRAGAERILVQAQSLAAPHVRTGAYLRSLHVEELPRKGRRVFAVVTDHPAGMAIEAAQGILARAVKAARSA